MPKHKETRDWDKLFEASKDKWDSIVGPTLTGPGSSPETAIDEQHPELPTSKRLKLKNFAEGISPEVMVRELKKEGFDVFPTADHYAIRKPGETKWHKVEKSGWGWMEMLKDLGDYGTDLIKDIGWLGGAGVGAAAGTAATGGPWGGLAVSIPAAGAGSGLAQGVVDFLARNAGIVPTEKESTGALKREVIHGAAGQAILGGAGMVAGKALKGIANKYRGWRTPARPPTIAEQLGMKKGPKAGYDFVDREITQGMPPDAYLGQRGGLRGVVPEGPAGKQTRKFEKYADIGPPEPLNIPEAKAVPNPATQSLEGMSEQELRTLRGKLGKQLVRSKGQEITEADEVIVKQLGNIDEQLRNIRELRRTETIGHEKRRRRETTPTEQLVEEWGRRRTAEKEGRNVWKPLNEMSLKELITLKEELRGRYNKLRTPKSGKRSQKQIALSRRLLEVNQHIKALEEATGGRVVDTGMNPMLEKAEFSAVGEGLTASQAERRPITVATKKIAELEAKDAKAGRASPFNRQFWARRRKGIRVEPQSEVAEKTIKANTDIKDQFFIEFIKVNGEPSGRRKVQAAISVATDKARHEAIKSGLLANMEESQLRLHAKMWGMPRTEADTVPKEKLLSFMYGKGDIAPKRPKAPKLNAPHKGETGLKRSYSPEDYGQSTLIDVEAGHYINFELEGVTNVSGKGGKFTRVMDSRPAGGSARGTMPWEPYQMLNRESTSKMGGRIGPLLQAGAKRAAKETAKRRGGRPLGRAGEAVYRLNRVTGSLDPAAGLVSRIYHTSKLKDLISGSSNVALKGLDWLLKDPATHGPFRAKLRRLRENIGHPAFKTLLRGYLRDPLFKKFWDENKGMLYASQT